MPWFLDSKPRAVIAALSSNTNISSTLDVDTSSLVAVEEVECGLGGNNFLLSDTVLGPCLGVEGGLGGGSLRGDLCRGGLVLVCLAH
jgi:hypothetical protein